jgi:hypothetical protein
MTKKKEKKKAFSFAQNWRTTPPFSESDRKGVTPSTMVSEGYAQPTPSRP